MYRSPRKVCGVGTGEHGPVEDKEQMKHRQSPTRRNPGSSSAVSGKFMILSQLNHRRRLRRIPKVSKSSGESQIGSIPGGTCAGQPAVSSLLASARHLHLETRAHVGQYAHAIASIKTRQTHAGACSRYQLRDGPSLLPALQARRSPSLRRCSYSQCRNEFPVGKVSRAIVQIPVRLYCSPLST